MNYPKVKIQSDVVYSTILRNLCDSCEGGTCRGCVVNDTQSGADWLRRMGIHINVVLWGSVVPKGISKFLIDRKFRRRTEYITHPLVVVWATVATVASIVLATRLLTLVP